jgi:hypothetical protein
MENNTNKGNYGKMAVILTAFVRMPVGVIIIVWKSKCKKKKASGYKFVNLLFFKS